MGLSALFARRLTRISVLLKAFQINGTVGSLRSPTYSYIGLTQSLSNKCFAFILLFLCGSAQSSKLVSRHRIKKASQRKLRGFVPQAGIEPARALRPTGFSYYYGFHHPTGL